MSRRVNFTKAVIEAAKPPAPGERLVLMDTKAPGLQCRITPTGVKTFSIYRRAKGGQPERVTLGKFPDMSVEKARTEAAKINAAIASGDSPAQIKRAHREERTFGELFEEYLEQHAKHKKRSWKKDERNYHLYLEKPFGKKKLSDITRANVDAVHAGISRQFKATRSKATPGTAKNATVTPPKRKSGATANRILALVSSVFSWSVRVGLCETNPAKGIKKNPERSRERFLQSDELPKFFKSLAMEENAVIRDYALVSLLTGARRANVMAMRWDQISFERKEWHIPRTKNDDPQTIPLMDEVIHVLHQRAGNGSAYVFPGEGKHGHLAEPRRGWERILKRAGIKDLRIHDLRRTMGSWQAKSGASLLIVGKSLGHKSAQATAVYSRLDLDPVRKSVETATGAILEAAGVKKTAPQLGQFVRQIRRWAQHRSPSSAPKREPESMTRLA